MLKVIKVDKFKTAVLNGYTEGQARALEVWSEEEFLIFMGGVIRPDGKRVQLMYEDGSIQFYSHIPKNKVVWQKSKYRESEWWCHSENDSKLASDLSKNGGKAVLGGYEYILKGDVIVKRVCRV